MKLAILVSALALAGPTTSLAADRIGEACSGTETVQVGTQAPTTVPYALTFSADLSAKSYCYDKCGPDQSYAIGDSGSDPVKLADMDHGGQTRLITFDRRTGVLSDYQSFDAGLGRIVRKASARCRSATFHEPATPAQSKAR